MKFFFDNNLSENLTRGLKDFGEDVVHLKDLFNEKTEDQVWLEEIGQKKMFLITRDERIRRNPFELNALKTYNVGAFFLGGKNLGRCKIIQQVIRNWPRIKELAEKKRPPFAYRIPPSGSKFSPINL
jgi:hypothetical protein